MFRAYLNIPFAPVAWARTRGSGMRRFTPARQRDYLARFVSVARRQAPPEPMAGPVRVRAVYRIEIPESWPKWKKEAARSGQVFPTGKSDVDNHGKMTLDALGAKRGGFFRDDAQVVFLELRKVYSAHPGTDIWIEGIEQPATVREWQRWIREATA